MNRWTLLADLVVAFHLGYVSYVVVGQLLTVLGKWLGWHWVRAPLFRWSHLAPILIVSLEGAVGWICPLTTLEQWLRERGGQDAGQISFVGRLVRDLLFVDVSQDLLNLTYVLFGLWVFMTAWLFPPRPFRTGTPGRGEPTDG